MMSNKKRKLKRLRSNWNRLIETEGNKIKKLNKEKNSGKNNK